MVSFFLNSDACVLLSNLVRAFVFFFFNDTATTEIYTLSLHDALPICDRILFVGFRQDMNFVCLGDCFEDRKSTRLNSSHLRISYAVFCLKKRAQAGACCCRAVPRDHTRRAGRDGQLRRWRIPGQLLFFLAKRLPRSSPRFPAPPPFR